MAWPHAATSTEAGRADGVSMGPEKPNTDNRRGSSSAERIASLKSYRRARGLCDRCDEKWFPGHKCPLLYNCKS